MYALRFVDGHAWVLGYGYDAKFSSSTQPKIIQINS